MENDSQVTNNPLGGNGPVLSKENGKAEDNTPEKLGNAENSKSGFVGLERKLGLVSGICLIIGTMIGSGIFASPRFVMENSGSVGLTLIVWSLCGVLAMFGALSYAELGTMIPLSGAEYAYLLEAFGALPAFLYSWTSVIVLKPSQVAIICLAFGAYVIEPIFAGCGDRADLQPIVKLLAALAIGIILFVNCASVKWASRMQIVFTVFKMVAIVMLIITGIVRLGQGFTESFENSFSGTTNRIGIIGFAFYNGLWAYDGWNNLNYVTEELKNPRRDLPWSIMIGIPLVTVCYVLVNIAYLTVLSPAEILTSSAVAVTLADRLYGVMAWVIPIFVASSTFGAANGSAFGGGRLVFAAAREGHLPKFLAMSIIAWIMLLPDSSSFETLINYFSFAAWVFYGVTVSALIWLRYKKPQVERPYRVPIVIPLIVVLASIYLVIAPFYEAPLESLYCVVFILAGIPFYLIFVRFNHVVPKWFFSGIAKGTYQLQKVLDVALPESETEMILS
ncbi:b0 [Acropora cervicornis]|uniref:b(0,+)-type amino acid transporter 1 n=1 Tax=Acropora cervicornis TaxID=6130 RepID=A0AAD9Q2I5_ACRCE|nr:b0 [Acropora cervicornis]